MFKQAYWYKWLEVIKKRFKHCWIALFIGAIASFAVVMIWKQLCIQEELQVQQLMQQEANTIQSILNRELSNRITSLNRMAKRWEINNGSPRQYWEADVRNYMEDTYGYQAIQWVDSSFRVRWIMPVQGNEQVQNLDMNQDPRRQISLKIARDLDQIILSKNISLIQGGQGFLVIIPLFVDERHDGFIIGVFKFQSLFDGILPVSSQYNIQIYDRNELVYSQGNLSSSEFQKTSIVRAYGADWEVQVSPTLAWIKQAKSPLPYLVLWGGLMLVWITAIAIYLGQRSQCHAGQTRKINQKLQHEILQRQKIEATLLDSQRQYQTLVENSPDIIERFDTNFKHIYVSPTLTELTGISQDAFIGKGCRDLGLSETMVNTWEAATNNLLKTGQKQIIEFETETVKGIRCFEMAIVPEINEANKITSILCISRDVTDRKQAEIAIQQQVERQHILSKVTNRIRRSLNLQNILSTTVLEVSNALDNKQTLVYKFDLNGSGKIIANCCDIYYQHDKYCFIKHLLKQINSDICKLSQQGLMNSSAEIWQRFQEKTHLVLPIYLEAEKLWGVLIVYSHQKTHDWKPQEMEMLKQLTEQLAIAIQQAELYHQLQIAHQELEQIYNLDSLTGIANRRYFDQRLQRECLELQRQQKPLSIIMCDIDYFKCYNDTYGHIDGDKCLQKVAHALQNCLKRPGDLIARYGGEEFIILLPNTPLLGAIEISKQLHQAIVNLNIPPGKIPVNFNYVTISMGISSQVPTQNQPPTQLIINADRALYEAKTNGRNKYVVYNQLTNC